MGLGLLPKITAIVMNCSLFQGQSSIASLLNGMFRIFVHQVTRFLMARAPRGPSAITELFIERKLWLRMRV